MTVVDWLLDSDPSVRWQVMRDLTGAPADAVAAERARVATEGVGGLSAKGVRFLQPPVDHGTVVTAVLDDTCGNLIQIPEEKRK